VNIKKTTVERGLRIKNGGCGTNLALRFAVGTFLAENEKREGDEGKGRM